MSYCIQPKQVFIWNNVKYIVTHTKSTKVQIEVVLTNGQENISIGDRNTVDANDLYKAWKNGELIFKPSKRLARASDAEDGTEFENRYPNLEEVSEVKRKKAEWRRYVILPLLDVPHITDEMIDARIEEVKKEIEKKRVTEKDFDEKNYPVSRSSILRWTHYFKESTRDFRSLLENTEGRRGGAGDKRFDPEVQNMFKEVVDEIYLVPEDVPITHVYEAIQDRVREANKQRKPGEKKLKAPSYPTVTRWIQELDPEEVLIAKLGEEGARNQLQQHGKMRYSKAPLARAEIDHTILDFIVLDQNGIPLGRLTITIAIDTATRYPLGYYISFGPGNYLSVMGCAGHSIMPKDTRGMYQTENEWLACGIFQELVTDNAPEFSKSKALEGACLVLGTSLIFAPRRTPEWKPQIERFLRTKGEDVIHIVPGTTFGDFLKKGEYDSKEYACIFLDQVDPLINTFIVDIYAQKPHRGLGGDKPAHRWAEMTRERFRPNFPGSAEELEIILCPYKYAVLWDYGIEFDRLSYNDMDNIELAILRENMRKFKPKGKHSSEPLKFKYNPADLSYIYVFDEFYEPGGRFIKVPSLDPEYTTGLTHFQHKVIKRQAKVGQAKVDMEALWRARAKISQMVLEGIERKGKLKTNTRLARLWTGGKATRNWEPSALSRPVPQQSAVENIPLPPPQEIVQPLFTRKTRQDTPISFTPQDPAI